MLYDRVGVFLRGVWVLAQSFGSLGLGERGYLARFNQVVSSPNDEASKSKSAHVPYR